MNKLFIATIIITVLPCKSHSQKQDELFLNWGLVAIGDSILIDQTEILIGEWLDYVHYHSPTKYPNYIALNELSDLEKAKLLSSEMIDSLLPDMNIIGHLPQSYLYKKSSNQKLIKISSIGDKVLIPVNADSLKNKKSRKRMMTYLETPVTGISYEQAMRFCKWRTTTDSLKFFEPPKGRHVIGNTYLYPLSQVSYLFSLPSPAEFDSINPNLDSMSFDKHRTSTFNYRNAIYSKSNRHKMSQEQCGRGLMKRFRFL